MIELRQVSRIFDGKRKVTALEGVDFQVERGEMVSIVGPSGSGKSTLLNLIGGLDRPSSGQVRINGAEILKLIHDLHERLGATILIVTHDVPVAESCSRTITLRDGRIAGDLRR